MKSVTRGPGRKARTQHWRQMGTLLRASVRASRRRKSNCKCDQCRGPNPYRREEIRRGGLAE